MSEASLSIFQTCSGTVDIEEDLAGFIECLSDQHEAVRKIYKSCRSTSCRRMHCCRFLFTYSPFLLSSFSSFS